MARRYKTDLVESLGEPCSDLVSSAYFVAAAGGSGPIRLLELSRVSSYAPASRLSMPHAAQGQRREFSPPEWVAEVAVRSLSNCGAPGTTIRRPYP